MTEKVLFERDAIYTLSEISEVLRVSRATLTRAISRGDLKAIRVGGQWRVIGRDVVRFLRRREAAS